MKRKLIVLLLCVLLLAAAGVCLFLFDPFGWKRADAAPTGISIEGFTSVAADGIGELGESVKLCAVGTYTGAYVEDGSDEPVTDVLAVVLENTGDEWIEYMQLSLQCGAETAYFECAALPAHASVLVLEANRLTYNGQDKLGTPYCGTPAYLTRAVMDFSAEFALYPSDGVINLQNISGADISSDVSVFYRNKRGNYYLGGIAYRVRIEGGVKADEIVQRMESHYSQEGSVILYMSYEK